MLNVTKTYKDISIDLEKLGAVSSQMFGMPTMKFEGKAFCGLFDDVAMVFKLAGKNHAAALKLKGAKLFDPSEMGRPMKEWVQVPFALKSEWPNLAEQAFQYLTTHAKEK